MYCYNCGKKLPDGAKFCNACGAAQTEAQSGPAPAQPPWQPQYAAPQPAPQPKKKSKAGLIAAVVAAIAAMALGAFVIAPSMQGSGGDYAGQSDLANHSQDSASTENDEAGTSDPSETPWSRTAAAAAAAARRKASSGEDSGQTERETNDAYYQVLDAIGYQMPNSPAQLEEGLSAPTVECFVKDNGDGSVECCDYAAEGDTVVKYYETTLLDLTIVPEDQKEQITASLMARLPELNALGFVTADYLPNYDGTVGILTVNCTDLDKDENWQALCGIGYASEDGPRSLSAIKQQILSAGFISLYK